MDDMKEFIAFSRKLLRELKDLKEALNQGDIEKAKKLLDNLIEDTTKDIEA